MTSLLTNPSLQLLSVLPILLYNYNNDTIDGENHVDAPVSTIIISIVYIVIIINHDDTDTIDGGQSC